MTGHSDRIEPWDGSEHFYYDSTTHDHHDFYNMDTGEMIDIPAEAACFAGVAAAPAGTEQDGVDVIIRVRNRD